MSAFEDSYTTSSGPTWVILDHPSFEEHINYLASALSTSASDKPAFIETYRARAAALTPAAEAPQPNGDADDDEEEREVVQRPLTEQEKKGRWELVKELVELAQKEGVKPEDSKIDLVALSALVVSLLHAHQPSTSSSDYITSLVSWSSALSTSLPESSTSLTPRYTALVDIYNSLPSAPSASARASAEIDIFQSLVRLAAGNGEFGVLEGSLASLTSRVKGWRAALEGDEGKQRTDKVVEQLAEELAKGGKNQLAFSVLLSYLAPSPSSPAPLSASPALLTHLLRTSFLLPSFLDYVSLGSIPALSSSSSSIPALYTSLLPILQSGTTAQFASWASSNASEAKEKGLDVEALKKKIQLLSLADLLADNVGKRVPYSIVAQALELPSSLDEEDLAIEVETWVIELTRTSLLSARLHEPTRTILVSRATPRQVSQANWEDLKVKLERIRVGVKGIIAAVQAGQQSTSGQGRQQVDGEQPSHQQQQQVAVA